MDYKSLPQEVVNRRHTTFLILWLRNGWSYEYHIW